MKFTIAVDDNANFSVYSEYDNVPEDETVIGEVSDAVALEAEPSAYTLDVCMPLPGQTFTDVNGTPFVVVSV